LKRQILLFILISAFPFEISADGFNSIAKTNSLLKKAEKAMKEKNFRLASKSYEEALKEDPELPAQAKLNLAHAYFETGQNRLAQKNYLSSLSGLSSVTQKSNACLQLGNLFVREKDYKNALDWYRKSLLHQPENTIARKNYEMAWKLNKQKEAEKEKQKKDPERDSPNNNQKNQQQKDQNQSPSEQDKNNSDRNQSGKGSDSNQQDNQNPEGKGKVKDREEQDKPEAAKQREEKQDEGKEEEKDDSGKDSRKKTNESKQEDPDAIRMDKKKLQESGLNEEQAKNMLKAMRQNEVKYLQQRQFKGKNSPKPGSGPRW